MRLWWITIPAQHDVGNGSVWSLGRDRLGLQPNATEWMPKFCDPQLFVEHVWFWEPNLHVRTLEDLVSPQH